MNLKPRLSGVSIAIQKTFKSLPNTTNLQGLSQYTVEVASTLKQREEVYQMVYQAYREKNFIPENKRGLHTIDQDICPDTLILLARDQYGLIAGTVTAVFDQSVSLPATKIYAHEIKELRDNGAVIAEVSRLAISKKHRYSKEILSLLFNHLAIYCHHIKKVTSLICEVNPRHVVYYQSILNFKQIGVMKPCPMVQENPAILLHLSIQNFEDLLNKHKEDSKFKALYTLSEFFEIAGKIQKQRKPITKKEMHYFGLSKQKSKVFIEKIKNRILTFK